MRLTKKATAITATIAVGALALSAAGWQMENGAAASLAASTAGKTAAPSSIYGCDTGSGRALTGVYTVPTNFQPCKNGFPVTVASGLAGKTGATGPKGEEGATGATGATGPSGVTATSVTALTATSEVPTGGSFNSKAVVVGTVDLKAGTYLVTLAAQSEPSSDTSAAGVEPQFFLYDQVKNAAFEGDLLNIGSGTLAPAGTSHDLYDSGTALITLTSDTTLYVYGFGYDNDTGASDYNLIAGSLTAVRITPAS